MEEADGPRVFEEGTVTQVLGPDSFNLYVGALYVKHVESAETLVDPCTGKMKVRIKFKRDRTQEVEENMRLVKTLPWVEII